jgi:hypothetical protein
VAFAWSHDTYDKMGNIQTTWRDEQAGLGEVFGYDQNSQLTSANYNVAMTTPTPTPSPTPTPTVATSTFAPAAGAYPASDYPKSITVSTTTTGAQMRYTTDNSIPTSGLNGHGTLINGSSGTATVPVGGATLKAIAYKSGYYDSAIKSGDYTVAAAVVMPTFSPVAGAYPASDYPKTVTISTTTSGAHIRYTKDGSTPGEGNGTLINGISGTASVAVNTTLKAIGLKTGLTDSAVKSGDYKASGYSDSAMVSGYFDNQNGGNDNGLKGGDQAKAGGQSSLRKQLAAAVGKKPLSPANAADAPGEAKWAVRLVDTLWKQTGAGQLKLTMGWSKQGGQGSTDATESARYVTYTLDSAGNRTNMTDGSSVSYAPNNLNQYATVNGSTVGYDNNGNLTSYGGWSYVYDADNRLISAIACIGVVSKYFDI